MARLDLTFRFSVPFFLKRQIDLFLWEPQISKNKAISFQLTFSNGDSISLLESISRVSWKEDHAGFNFEVGLLGLWFNIHFYDIRHWNDDEDRWEKYD